VVGRLGVTEAELETPGFLPDLGIEELEALVARAAGGLPVAYADLVLLLAATARAAPAESKRATEE